MTAAAGRTRRVGRYLTHRDSAARTSIVTLGTPGAISVAYLATLGLAFVSHLLF